MSKEFFIPQVCGPTTPTTTGGASANVALPLGDNGAKVRYVLFSVELGKECFIKPFATGGANPADATLIHLSDSMNGIVLNVGGCTNVRHLQKTAAAIFYMTPLGNT